MSKSINLQGFEDYFFLEHFWDEIMESPRPSIKSILEKLQNELNGDNISITKYYLVLATIGKELTKALKLLKEQNKLEVTKLVKVCKFAKHPLAKTNMTLKYSILSATQLLMWGSILEDYIEFINRQFKNVYIQRSHKITKPLS